MKRWVLVFLALGCAPGFSTAENEYFTTNSGVTGVTAGTGLTGGGTSGDVTLSIDQTQSLLTPAGTAAAPAIGIGETNTGFYRSGSHQTTFTSNGAARIDFLANGVGNPNTSDSAGMFFSGADLNLNDGGGDAFIKFSQGNTGYLMMQMETGNAWQVSIPASGGLAVTYNVTVGSFTVTGPAAPTDSKALCLLSGQLGHCTTVVGATGGCTCTVP